MIERDAKSRAVIDAPAADQLWLAADASSARGYLSGQRRVYMYPPLSSQAMSLSVEEKECRQQRLEVLARSLLAPRAIPATRVQNLVSATPTVLRCFLITPLLYMYAHSVDNTWCGPIRTSNILYRQSTVLRLTPHMIPGFRPARMLAAVSRRTYLLECLYLHVDTDL